MTNKTRITDIIFDYDGTCTQIPVIYEGFLKSYFNYFLKQLEREHLSLTDQEWQDALALVRSNSPKAGWTIGVCASAPAAADPYILAFEAANYILRKKKAGFSPDRDIFPNAYKENTAPWREDAAQTFIALQKEGIRLHFISNSSTAAIQERLKLLTGVDNISVDGGAAKYNICELAWDPGPKEDELPEALKKQFADLPSSDKNPVLNKLGRPAYLRRGSYFEAICRCMKNDLNNLATTVFCGDIWELDLAMPYALGANIHLMERAAPFVTYAYELEIVAGYGKRGKIGKELSDLMAWV
jgi:hypothetical protein